MQTHWIPREKRWTNEERKQKEIEARNKRELTKMFWIELEKIRSEIEREIETKKLARIKLLE